MPGYGIAGPGEGRGLLPWSWAEERIAAARRYWLATVAADGAPHVTFHRLLHQHRGMTRVVVRGGVLHPRLPGRIRQDDADG